jgi:hypothetical protein
VLTCSELTMNGWIMPDAEVFKIVMHNAAARPPGAREAAWGRGCEVDAGEEPPAVLKARQRENSRGLQARRGHAQ